ncbi:Uncharacterised protein [Acetobacterium wieringae]|uniref:HK97-gp10 family putative phage morphogenesis protein n=1 Tax=Acetobacterium wieringae TaxID=52694 RepID=UPI001DC01678|nr:HK97-gp10 family putative phage morphogenesis protein [Acetobacterium wieringae]VUZ27855.1 Uncharacterised protein [Acetobacterium wieringae]
MARCAFMAGEEFAIKLERLATDMDAVAREAIYEGTKIVADEVKKNLQAVISEEATGGLVDAFGITPIDKDIHGWNAKVGFDGYDETQKTKKYPKGVAYQLKARAMESGTSTRRKKPFMRPAMKATKLRVTEKMNEIIDQRTREIFG